MADQAQLYRALLSGLAVQQRLQLERAVTLVDGRYDLDPSAYTYLTDTPVESLCDLFPPGTFDVIVSRAVMEHVYDVDQALDTMDVLLKPGGIMIHEVDLRDHGIFTRYGLHPLTFLTFGQESWHKMSSHNGSPNRVPMQAYRKRLEARNYRCETLQVYAQPFRGDERKVHKKGLECGVDYDGSAVRMVQAIRPWLNRSFASLPDQELLVGAFFLVARKAK